MRVASLHTYPVKGCHRLDHDEARVEPWGLAGDRRWMIIDADGVGVTQRETTALVRLRPRPRAGGLVLRAADRPDLDVAEPVDGPAATVRIFRTEEAVPARLAGAGAAAWLTGLLGRPVRLAWLDDPTARPVTKAPAGAPIEPGDTVGFADAHPLLLANAASLDALNDWLDEPVPVARFRPNIVVAGAAPWAEDDWIGRRLRIGGLAMRVAGPCDRCVVTTIDQESGDKGREPLRALGRYRRHELGLLFGVHLIPDGAGVIRVGESVGLLP